MAQSSQDILNQIQQQYGNPADASNIIESTIKNAYAPSIKNLVEEGNTLRGQYYPAFFNKAQELGTGAGDMSPAARLAAMQNAGESMGQLYRTNLGLRDFYNTDINSLVGRAQNQYNAGYGALKDQYSMALQGEQARATNDANSALQKYLAGLGTPTPTATSPEDFMNQIAGANTGWIKNLKGEATPVKVFPGTTANIEELKAQGASPVWSSVGNPDPQYKLGSGDVWKLQDGTLVYLEGRSIY